MSLSCVPELCVHELSGWPQNSKRSTHSIPVQYYPSQPGASQATPCAADRHRCRIVVSCRQFSGQAVAPRSLWFAHDIEHGSLVPSENYCICLSLIMCLWLGSDLPLRLHQRSHAEIDPSRPPRVSCYLHRSKRTRAGLMFPAVAASRKYL